MLSPFSRLLTYVNAFLYAITGIILFFLPGQMGPVFAWKVTPFMTMTIGGWCLGNAWLAFITARRWKWSLVYVSLIYLWLFGLFQAAVVVAFRSKLALGNPIAWLYLVTLAANFIAALVGIVDCIRLKPAKPTEGPAVHLWTRLVTAIFIVFVGFLAVYGLVVQVGAPGTNGGIFPEIMTLFTLRAFAAFYLSIALGVVPLLIERNLWTFLHHSIASYGLIVAITLAAFINLGLFDFAKQPGGLLYFGAYLVVGIILLVAFLKLGTGSKQRTRI